MEICDLPVGIVTPGGVDSGGLPLFPGCLEAMLKTLVPPAILTWNFVMHRYITKNRDAYQNNRVHVQYL